MMFQCVIKYQEDYVHFHPPLIIEEIYIVQRNLINVQGRTR